MRNRALVGETTIHFDGEPKPVIIFHKPILDKTTFDQLQAMLDERKLSAPRSDVFYCLSGLVFCGCGARFEPTKIGKNRYYRCKAYCGEPAWRKDKLESEVYQGFSSYLMSQEQLQSHLEMAEQPALFDF